MHTGYDNFWMYQNIRHEPVLSLSKNDSYKCAVLTDSYKPLPNGGSSSHLSNCLIPQSNVANSHQYEQSRMANSQCVWPSSVYSLSFNSSYANNFQSPETYSSQSTNLNCSTRDSQVQQNYDSNHLKNSSSNFPQMFINTNKSNNNYNNFVHAQSSENNDVPVSRIRVKDMFSLNNCTFSNSLFENNELLQIHQKEQPKCTLNYATVNSFTSCDSKTPAEYMDYEKMNLYESNHPHPPYGHKTIEETNHQKFLQHSDLFYQQNMPLSVESQFHFNCGKKMEKNLPSETLNANCNWQLPTSKYSSSNEIQNIQRTSSELTNFQNSEAECSYINKEKTNNIHYYDSLEANERIKHDMSKINRDACRPSDCQKNLSETDEASSFRQAFLNGELKKNIEHVPSNRKCSPNQKTEQESNLIKITIPHTGQSSFIPINDSSGTEKNPSLSLPCLIESENQLLYDTLNRKSPVHKHNKTEKNGIINLSLNIVNQDSSLNSKIAVSNTNSVYSNSGLIQNHQSADIKESDHSFHSAVISSPKKLESCNDLDLKKHDGINDQKNYTFHKSAGDSENTLDNVNPKTFIEEESKSRKIISQNDTVLKAIKLENFYSEVENSKELIPGDRVFPKIVKIEKNVEDFSLNKHEPEPSTSENRVSEETHFSDVDDTENIDFSKGNVEINTEKPEPKSEIIFSALKNAENHIQELDISEDKTGKVETVFWTKNKMESIKTKKEDVFQSRNYKSKINKEKLDLLIQFLNKDEETVEMNASEETDSSHYLKETSFINKQEKEVRLNRNRRKLSKTCVVKNKNNSREMISLISPKVARMDVFKCSSETPQIVRNGKNLDQNEKISEEDSSMTDRSVNFSENYDKIINHSQENQSKKEDCLIPESKIGILECKNKDISEKYTSGEESSNDECNISITMRSFQNLRTYFCASCDLILSVDSFWINVVSGELRCLNCFKKMMIRFEGHILNSKSVKVDGNTNSEANLFQKDQKKLASENRKENVQKPGFEYKSVNYNELTNAEFECDHQNSDDLKENIEQKPIEIINDSSHMHCEEINLKSECYTVDVNFSDTSKRQNVFVEDKVLVLKKTGEEQNKLIIEESLNKCVKNVKWKEGVTHTSNVIEDGSKQETAEFSEKSIKKNIAEDNEMADKAQSSRGRASPLKSKQINVLKEKCSSPKTFLLNQSNRGKKNVLKDKSICPKAKVLKSYNEEEKLSDQPMSKSNFIETSITNETQVLKEGTKSELTDKAEKSNSKYTSKEECISEKFIKTVRKKSIGTTNQNRKKTNSEEIPSQKLQISQEHPKKEIKVTDSLDKSVTEMCSRESCGWQKTHNSEDTEKRNVKYEPLDKLKMQNALKENCFDQKSKISEILKIKETDILEKSRRNYLLAQNFKEKHATIKRTNLSKKRKNVEGFAALKVRIVEEHTKKERKFAEHISGMSKEDSECRINKALEHEKQNEKDSGENTLKNSSSEEKCLSSGNSVKKMANQMSFFSEKSKVKDDLACPKKTLEHSKHRRNSSSEVPRRKSKDKCFSPMPNITKGRSKNETRKIMESLDNLRRNSTSKQDSESVSKHFKNGSLPIEKRKCKKIDEKEKKNFMGKIPKKSRADLI